MRLITAEHYELLEQFERTFKHMPLTREAKEYWPMGPPAYEAKPELSRYHPVNGWAVPEFVDVPEASDDDI